MVSSDSHFQRHSSADYSRSMGGDERDARSDTVEVATKAQRRAAQEQVSQYYERALGELIDHVEEALVQHRAGEMDVHEVDNVIHQYPRPAATDR